MSRTKLLLILFSVVIGSLLVTIMFFATKRKVQQKQTTTQIQNIPSFKFETIYNNIKLDSDLTSLSERIVINFFSPNCEHCQYMATLYQKNKEQLKNVIIVMITIADSGEVAKFIKDYQLTTLPNVVLLRDTKFQFYKIFGTSTVPSFFIYEHQKLVKKIIGETKIENLIN